MDCSSRYELKLAPILVVYLKPETRIKQNLIEYAEVNGEKSELLNKHLVDVIIKNNISLKVVCFSADNTGTNFGGVHRIGANNVHTRLQTHLPRELLGIG